MNVLQQCYDEGIYPISFFNYMGLGDPIAGVPDSVKDWAELGITVGRSPNYDGSPDRVPEMRAILDACAERGMKLIVDDHRTTFHRYMEAGEAEYRKGVLQAVKDLEGHPALLGFDLGPEHGALLQGRHRMDGASQLSGVPQPVCRHRQPELLLPRCVLADAIAP